MLTEKEEKLIRKYCLLPAAAVAALVMALGLGGLYLILVMVDEIALKGAGFYSAGLAVYLGLTVALVSFALYGLFAPQLGMTKQAWGSIIYRVNMMQAPDSSDLTGPEGPFAEGGPAVEQRARSAREAYRNARMVANLCGVEVPRARRVVLPVVLVPALVLTAVFIPRYAFTSQTMDREKRAAADTLSKLGDALQTGCWDVYADDPYEDYSDYGYSVHGYLTDYDDPGQADVYIYVDKTGLVEEVSYAVDIDVTVSKEENIANMTASVAALQAMLADVDVPLSSPDLLDSHPISESFLLAFKNGSYYRDIYLRDSSPGGARLSYDFSTTSEEEYDEYAWSTFYLTVEDYGY